MLRQLGTRTNLQRTPSDAELLAAVAEGDPVAFGVLYDQHAPWLLVRLRQRTSDSDLADQIAQETFLVVWRDAGRFQSRGEVGAWIWGIAILAFLCVAPLLPLDGIAVAYGPGIDPTYEISLAAPLRSFRLLLLRAATVLGTATLLAAAASLALPRLGPDAAGWLLPSLGLTASSLALATRVEPLRAIGITAGAWVVAVAVTVIPAAPSSVLFAGAGQVAFAVLALLAAAVVLLRRGAFESDRGFDTTPRFAERRLR